MSTVQKSIDINAPVNSVYNQWTQFEDFPAFILVDDKGNDFFAQVGSGCSVPH